MKLSNVIECPKCTSTNTRVNQYLQVSLWDDEHYKFMEKEFENPSHNYENIIYKCICDSCKNVFHARLKLKCEVVSYEIETQINTWED